MTRETGCNSHVSVHRNCNIECLTSRAYTFVCKCREQAHFSVFYQTHFSKVSELEAKEKVICYIYVYVEKKSMNSGITICSFNLDVTCN